MADNLVDTRADTPRELVVPEGTRVRVTLDALVVHDLINLERRDSRTDRRGGNVQHFAGELFVCQRMWCQIDPIRSGQP